MRVRSLISASFVAGLTLALNVAAADVYKCKDAKGAVTFVDTPCPIDQNTVDHKVTNDPNTLGKQPAKAREKSSSRSGSRPTTEPGESAPAGSTAKSADSGCDNQRKRLARLQTQSCIEGLHVLTGKVMCMPEAERREYLSRLKSTVEAVCS